MNGQSLFQEITEIKVWKRGNKRALHKPLLLLISLANIANNKKRLSLFEDIQGLMISLLIRFGEESKSYHPEYPFWNLQKDGSFWEIPEREMAIELREKKNCKRKKDIPPDLLIQAKARGGFTESAFNELMTMPELFEKIVRSLLDENFPERLHLEVLEAVGLPQF